MNNYNDDLDDEIEDDFKGIKFSGEESKPFTTYEKMDMENKDYYDEPYENTNEAKASNVRSSITSFEVKMGLIAFFISIISFGVVLAIIISKDIVADHIGIALLLFVLSIAASIWTIFENVIHISIYNHLHSQAALDYVSDYRRLYTILSFITALFIAFLNILVLLLNM